MSDHKPEERAQDLEGSLIWKGTEIKPFPLAHGLSHSQGLCVLSGLGSGGLGEDRAWRLVSVKVSTQKPKPGP